RRSGCPRNRHLLLPYSLHSWIGPYVARATPISDRWCSPGHRSRSSGCAASGLRDARSAAGDVHVHESQGADERFAWWRHIQNVITLPAINRADLAADVNQITSWYQAGCEGLTLLDAGSDLRGAAV